MWLVRDLTIIIFENIKLANCYACSRTLFVVTKGSNRTRAAKNREAQLSTSAKLHLPRKHTDASYLLTFREFLASFLEIIHHRVLHEKPRMPKPIPTNEAVARTGNTQSSKLADFTAERILAMCTNALLKQMESSESSSRITSKHQWIHQ